MGDELVQAEYGVVVGEVVIDGRALQLRRQMNKGAVVAQTLIALERRDRQGGDRQGGDAGGYRGEAVREIEIDPILVRKETSVDRFGKRVGLNMEVQLGDAAADRALYFETTTAPDVVEALFAAPELRRAVLAAVQSFDTVLIGSPAGLVACKRSTDAASFAPQDPVLQGLVLAVADAMPAVRRRPDRDAGRRMRRVGLVLALEFTLLVTAFQVPYAGALDAPELLSPVLAGAIATIVVSLLVVRPLSAGRSNGLRVFLLATFATLFGLTCVAIAAFNFGNRWLDFSPPRRVEVSVLASRFPSKNSSGFVRVRGMPAAYAPSDAEGVATIPGRWAEASGCLRTALLLHPGRFGVVWVESYSCAAWAGTPYH